MVKGFEHLSDAQLEQYGTENFAVISDDAQRIEAHLEECADCRSRVLEHQRARLDFMTDDSMKASPPAADCIPEDDLRNLAAGITTPDSGGDRNESQAKALAITQHVAQCPHCAGILRTFTEDFSDDLTPEEIKAENEFQAQLKSASPNWQKDIVSHAMKANFDSAANRGRAERRGTAFGKQKSEIRSEEADSAGASAGVRVSDSAIRSASIGRPARTGGWFPRWILVPTALAACAAIAFAVWFTQRDTPEKVEKLLAQAYTEQRTMEMRIPYAEHSDFKQTRSGEGTSLVNSPEALRKAADLIATHVKSTPNDPNWLLLSAQLDLLDWHYTSALSTINKIDDDKFVDSAEFRTAQSLALYEKAEMEHDSQSYGQVVDLLGKTLQNKPNDPIALFNQALACEKLYMYECASTDYSNFLKVEPSSGWSSEAQYRLNRIKEKKTPRP